MKRLGDMTVGLIGLGQIGGSIGLDLVAGRLVREVIGFDVDKSTITKAKRQKVIDRFGASLQETVRGADIVILATPIRKTLASLGRVCHYANKDAVVMDVTSTKKVVFEKLKQLDAKLNYVSGHPLAGSEKIGLDASRRGMFKNAPFVLIPWRDCDKGSQRIVTTLVRRLGARPLSIDPVRHDKLTALSIQVPYLAAYLISRMAVRQGKKDPDFWKLTGGSIQSTSRVMKSSPELTLDMFVTNSEELVTRIDSLKAELDNLKELLIRGETSKLKRQIVSVRDQLVKHR